MPGRNAQRGVVAMLAAAFLYVANEALAKLASDALPTGQLMAVRGIFTTLLILAVILATGNGLHLKRVVNRAVALRSGVDTLGSFLYMVALFHMPIGNMMAINMASPLMLTAAGALFLREPVGWRRWSAVLLGFFGVLLIVRPTATGFNIYALLGVLAVACLVARDMLTRGIDRGIPSLIVILANMATMTVGSLAVATVEGWAPIGWREILLLAGSAALIAGGAQCLVIAFREGALSVVAPLRYTALLWALLFGFLLWGDVPNALAWTGILLIVTSGLYVWHRGRNPA